MTFFFLYRKLEIRVTLLNYFLAFFNYLFLLIKTPYDYFFHCACLRILLLNINKEIGVFLCEHYEILLGAHAQTTHCFSLRHETSYRQPSCPLGKTPSAGP